MIFVDTNVVMYAVGASHPHRQIAVDFFLKARAGNTRLVTSAEVLQELLHVYSSVRKLQSLYSALKLIDDAQIEVWPLVHEDVILAAQLHDAHPALSARDLCHLASCRRRGVREIMTFDRALASVFGSPPIS